MVFLAAAKHINAVPTTKAVFFNAAIASCLLFYEESKYKYLLQELMYMNNNLVKPS